MADGQSNAIPRQEFSFTTTSAEGGRLRFRMVDRLNIDDVVLHLIHRKIHEVLTDRDNGVDVPRLFKDSLIKERFTAR